jgi:predicted enzyme related to lactoylglutathione lyase
MPAEDQAESTSRRGISHGQVCYLQIPALDVTKSAHFFAKVFGWQVQPPDAGFEAPGLIGQWVTDRPPTSAAGLLAWINVDSIDGALQLVRANGGEVVEAPSPDGPRWLATVRDPGGNTLGIVQHGSR